MSDRKPAREIVRDFPILEIADFARLVDHQVEVLGQEGSAADVGADPAKLRAFIEEIGRRYRSNPYHNFHHATDVVHTLAWMLARRGVRALLGANEAFWLLVTAIMHDVDHTGRNNLWEVAVSSELARRYPEGSILERNSLALAREIMERPACRFHATMKPADVQEGLQLLEHGILATDFSRHKEFVAGLTASIAGPGHAAGSAGYRRAAMDALIKGADIGNVTHSHPQARLWAARVMQEFWDQGRMERDRGLPVGPLNDPAKTTLVGAQVGFIKFVAGDLFRLLGDIDPDLLELNAALNENLRRYEAEGAAGRP